MSTTQNKTVSILSADHNIRPDDRDLAYAQKAAAFRHVYGVPMNGDVVRLPDGSLRRIADIWQDVGKFQPTGTIGGPSFYLIENGHVSYSGSLDQDLPLDKLTWEGEWSNETFWAFHHGYPQAHSAVYFSIPVRVWVLTPAA